MLRVATFRTPRAAWGVVCLVLLMGHPARGEGIRDGKRFDPGAVMTEPATNAPPELARVASTLGDWDVSYQLYRDGAPVHTASGRARITFMNRGHAYMERFHCPDFNGDGDDLTTVSFLMFDPGASVWVLGVASCWRENISLFDGSFEEDTLVLRNDIRQGGGSLVTHYRVRSRVTGEDEFEASLEQSTDGNEWQLRVVKTYRRRTESDDFFAARTPYGTPASDVPPEARQFDFLIGEWDEVHDMKLPSGPVHFPAHGTAVYCLDGHGIMEFSWYDVDPTLPDAATSIVRLYNRSMRRWECMYSNNRFNNILHFGGVQEGDRIVLHRFGADAADVPISYWIFHDMEEDSYRWHAETSRDRGVTFDDTWTIQGTRTLDD